MKPLSSNIYNVLAVTCVCFEAIHQVLSPIRFLLLSLYSFIINTGQFVFKKLTLLFYVTIVLGSAFFPPSSAVNTKQFVDLWLRCHFLHITFRFYYYGGKRLFYLINCRIYTAGTVMICGDSMSVLKHFFGCKMCNIKFRLFYDWRCTYYIFTLLS